MFHLIPIKHHASFILTQILEHVFSVSPYTLSTSSCICHHSMWNCGYGIVFIPSNDQQTSLQISYHLPSLPNCLHPLYSCNLHVSPTIPVVIRRRYPLVQLCILHQMPLKSHHKM